MRRSAALVLIALTSAAALPGPASANQLAVELSLHVPVTCSIQNVSALDYDRGVVQIDASCNAEFFRLVIGGDLGNLAPHTVSAINGDVIQSEGNVITVRARQPGTLSFHLDYDHNLDSVTSASAYIQSA